MDDFFDRDFVPMLPVWQESGPSANIYETDTEVVAELSLPGIDAKEVDVEVENDTLTVKGESKKETTRKDRHYYRREFSRRSFSRSLILPTEVQADKAKATMKDGILTVTVPKAESAKRKKVKVAVGR